MFRRRAQKGARRSSARSLARRLLDENPPESRSRRLANPFHLTAAKPDCRNFDPARSRTRHHAALVTDGYDAKANRDGARRRGVCPVIPYKSNAIDRTNFFPKALYKARARIEQAVGKLKRFKRIALRCEKTARNYGSFVALSLGFILIKSVHTA
jgi:transposase